jgi:hypothetical protein
MFPPWAPFFSVLAAGRITAARNTFRSATKLDRESGAPAGTSHTWWRMAGV